MSDRHGMGAQVLHELYQRDMGICQVCFRYADIRDCNVDHVVPAADGGTDDMDNLQLTHYWCNTIKADNKGKINFNAYWYQKPTKKQLYAVDRRA